MAGIKEIRLILGDQLNAEHSWFDTYDDSVLFVLMEVLPESEYVTHHIQKIVGIFTAMRRFAQRLDNEGHRVRYFRINDKDNKQSFEANLRKLIEHNNPEKLQFMEPDEYRLDVLLRAVFTGLGVPFEVATTEHFLTDRMDVKTFFEGKKTMIMEAFYRSMRDKYNVLMEGPEAPMGGQWNYDKENRKKLPSDVQVPPPKLFSYDVTDVVNAIQSAGIISIGAIDPKRFIWPVTRADAVKLFEAFLENLFQDFGTYQDALSESGWSLFHSRLSFALNIKLISPMYVIRRAEAYWTKHSDDISISQVEGFIRQILGWREYMRGIYWAKMPEFKTMNYFDHHRRLPDFFWTGQTQMRCVSKAIEQSLEKAYAHHIQRLMVTGNFALLAGIDPDEVDQWYLGIYIDAFEWVEITNTRGMSQYADGGIVATKPYVSSASYIHKMGNHCTRCAYKHNVKTGDKACPFNSLYWHFLDRHRDKLQNNPRMGMMYRVWERMGSDKKADLLEQAEIYLNSLDKL